MGTNKAHKHYVCGLLQFSTSVYYFVLWQPFGNLLNKIGPAAIRQRGIAQEKRRLGKVVDICKAYVDALHDGLLNDNQSIAAHRMYSIMTAFAKVGLVAIIDEVTGYQDERDRSDLQKILAKYISQELMPWTKRFPDEFYNAF